MENSDYLKWILMLFIVWVQMVQPCSSTDNATA